MASPDQLSPTSSAPHTPEARRLITAPAGVTMVSPAAGATTADVQSPFDRDLPTTVPDGLTCPGCLYELGGLPGPLFTCPECGMELKLTRGSWWRRTDHPRARRLLRLAFIVPALTTPVALIAVYLKLYPAALLPFLLAWVFFTRYLLWGLPKPTGMDRAMATFAGMLTSLAYCVGLGVAGATLATVAVLLI